MRKTIESPAVDESVLEELARVDIAYEMEQFTRWVTKSPPLVPGMYENLRLRQATFEVYVLHHRNLAEFLRRDRPTEPHRATDVVADHYFEEGWIAKPKPMRLYDATSSTRDGRARHNVDVHLAHVTSLRVERRRKNEFFTWESVDDTLVLTTFERFVEDLSAVHSDRGRWFESALGRARECVRALRTGTQDRVVHTTTSESVITVGGFNSGTALPPTPSE